MAQRRLPRVEEVARLALGAVAEGVALARLALGAVAWVAAALARLALGAVAWVAAAWSLRLEERSE